jgi:hypothetical protein
MGAFQLKVWRLHPDGVRIEPAERTLGGTANPDALKWCGPYAHANKAGFWVYPPFDIDLVWNGGPSFAHRVIEPVTDAEVDLVRSLQRPDDPEGSREFVRAFGGRTKLEFARVEPNIFQVWTGCMFETPPGWALHLRSPINLGVNPPYRIQEGILETDWMRYDIWINVIVTEPGLVIRLRRDQSTPLAQLVPVRRESYDQPWEVVEQSFHRDTEEGDRRFLEWTDYNHKKYITHAPHKDQATYYKERRRHVSRRSSDPSPAE